MWDRLFGVFVVVSGLALTAAACGPIPQNSVFTDGYRGYRTIPARTAATPAPPAETATAQPGAATADSTAEDSFAQPLAAPAAAAAPSDAVPSTGPTGPTGPKELVVVDLEGTDRYHLIDPNHRTCFLQEGSALTAIDCSTVPEAAQILGAASTRPAPPVHAAPAPKVPATEAAPAPPAPTREEKRRFAVAYIDSWCAATSGSTASRTSILEGHGFAPERYEEIQRWMGADPRVLERLDGVARDTCRGTDA